MSVNWDILVPGPGGVLIPTYGKYGGPGYSDGEVLDYPTQPVDYSSKPVDALDALFKRHDKAYDSLDPLDRAIGDLALLEGISRLPNGQLDPEASVYAGLATLLFIQQLTIVNDHPELLSEKAAIRYTSGALHDIERGLAELDASDRTALQDWLEDTAIAAGGTVAEEVAGLLSIIELHGLQARISNVHLAGPKLAGADGGTFAPLFTADDRSFDFAEATHLSKGQQIAGEIFSGDFSAVLTPFRADGPDRPQQGASLSDEGAGLIAPEHQKHLLADYLLL
ncbi:hypothetical protein [Microvirga makkahensis]|uniref:Uncharacterized protein n=1 Tax=Microvirga makkahensis TaxID=1128670 RepID=A0A7X3MSY6_9HYPH|nr:hypothetical protein [Microvirga makkahensis]MXQ12657.1 hypothetical protein [Microvirga makkahensis]